MATTTSKTMKAARQFVAAARAYGWRISSRENVVTITKSFRPGDENAFRHLDGEWYGILSVVPARGGSVWGTDGSGVGGYSAILHGVFTMNVSGVSGRTVAAIREAIEDTAALDG